MCDVKKCSICNLIESQDVKLREAILDGEGDVYNVELCNGCYSIYVEDYVTPAEVTELFETQLECEVCNTKVHVLNDRNILKHMGDYWERYKVCINCINRYDIHNSYGLFDTIPLHDMAKAPSFVITRLDPDNQIHAEFSQAYSKENDTDTSDFLEGDSMFGIEILSYGNELHLTLVGCCTLGYADSEVELTKLPYFTNNDMVLCCVYIKEEARGYGYGLRMIKGVLEIANKKDCNVFAYILEDWLEGYYAKLGFVRVFDDSNEILVLRTKHEEEKMQAFTDDQLEFEVKNVMKAKSIQGDVKIILHCNDNRVPKIEVSYYNSSPLTKEEIRQEAICEYRRRVKLILDVPHNLKIGDKL